MSEAYRIFPLGDSALTIEFGNVISVELNQRAIALSDNFEANRFPGFIETVPAYASTTIFYDVAQVKDGFPDAASAFEAVRGLAENALQNLDGSPRTPFGLIEIPVRFDVASALDLEHVAEVHGLAPSEVVDIFISRTYRVFMLGFLPGFTYMAEVDGRIATPRKDAPRMVVPKGSIGIAGKQTGIYSLESAGGWQILGRTDVEMFTPDGERPTLLRPGDQVSFTRAE
jgi:inhibitor of KinA